MTEDINNENVPEENTPKNPTESNSVSGEQTEQATDANPTAAPVLEQAVEGGTANQEIPQQAPVPPTESVAPQGQQTAFEQQVASPFTNPVSPTAPTVTDRKELIVLPIISFVVSVITLILAWFAPLPIIYVIIAFLGLIYAIVGLIVNIQRKKVLSIIALVLASLIFLVSGLAVFVRQAQNNPNPTEQTESKKSDEKDDTDIDDDDSKDSTDVKDYIADGSDFKFKWTKSKFTDLKFSSYSNKNGDSLKSVVKKFGKGSNATISGDKLSLEYEKGEGNSRKSVHLTFTKQRKHNGKFILSDGYISFTPKDIKIVSEKSYKSDWTQADVDALTVGDSSTGKSGTNLNEILKKHGNPTEAKETILNYGDGFKKSLEILYNSYSSDGGSKLGYVSLNFVQQNDDYLLTYKYPKK
ncbi:YybS family protein [Streptococcus mutans]|uniref:MFS transporter n=1 Tax=Streptococcus mutans TaxID=1309 RepID=UPI0014556699|nr:MFS transporter [Streptococcus mutans]NLQ65857.1 MFS transporter [Streptococcus mutans]